MKLKIFKEDSINTETSIRKLVRLKIKFKFFPKKLKD